MSNITNALAPYAPWLLAIFIKGTVLLLAAGAATQLLRKASAALRHFLYAAAMTTLLLLPITTVILPSLRVAVLPATAAPQGSVAPAAREISEGSAAIQIERKSVGPRTRVASTATTHSSRPAESPNAVEHAYAFVPTQNRPSWAGLNSRGLFVLIWLCGVALFLVRLLVLSLRLHALIRRAVPVDAIMLGSRLRWLCRDLGIRREVVLLGGKKPTCRSLLAFSIQRSFFRRRAQPGARRDAMQCYATN